MTPLQKFQLHRILPAFAMGAALFAQSPAPSDQPHAWRRADAANDQAQQIAQAEVDPPLVAQANGNPAPPPPAFTSSPAFSQAVAAPRVAPDTPLPQAAPAAHLELRPGTFITVRVGQFLSSDKNQQGDTFFATLTQPVIVDGIVVARRGQTVLGRVTDARKAGRTEGTSRLGLELVSLTLVDGQQLNVQSQVIGRDGGTSVGRDAGAIATTTALGAAIGAAADYGRGAAIGAGAGAAAGILGVLFTRGHASEVYPEQQLTFRMTAAADIVTERAPLAYRYAESADYGHDTLVRSAPQPRVRTVAVAPYYYDPFYSYGYYPRYYPSYWGSGLSLGFGYGRGYGYRGGGYRGGGFRR